MYNHLDKIIKKGTHTWPDGTKMSYTIDCRGDFVISGELKDGPLSLDSDVPIRGLILDGVTSVGASNFSGWKSLNYIYVRSGSLVRIGPDAFANCPNLRVVDFEDTLVSIGSGAFRNCPSLRYVEFPESLRSIEDRAFASCENLRFAVMPRGHWVKIGEDVFDKGVEKIEMACCNRNLAKIFVDEIRPNEYNDYSGCTVDIHLTVYSYRYSRKFSFWLTNQDTGWTGDSIMDGIYESELECNADFDEDMNLCDIYTEEELEEMAWNEIMNGYEFIPEECPFLYYIQDIQDALEKRADNWIDEDGDVNDPDLDNLLKPNIGDFWPDLDVEELIDFETMAKRGDVYCPWGKDTEDYAMLVEDFETETVYEDPLDKPLTSVDVPEQAIEYCRAHPANCLLLPYAICMGMSRTHFLPPRRMLRKASRILNDTDWNETEDAEKALLSLRSHILGFLKKGAMWVDIENVHFSRYENCSDEVKEGETVLGSLCKVLEALCPKTGYGLALAGPFEFTADRSGDIRRLKDEHKLVIPEKIAYDFLVGTELRDKYSKEMFDKTADYYDDEEYHRSRLSTIRDEVFYIIENQYLEEGKPGRMFDASLVLKEYGDGTFVEQLLAAESEDDFHEEDEYGTHASHGIRYSCSDNDYVYSEGEMVNVNPGYMRVVENEELPYRDTVHIPSTVESLGKTYPVVSIDQEAFSRCDRLKKVKIDEGLRRISKKAFSGCTGLDEISLPASLVELEESCFEGCTSLRSIFIPAGVEEMDISCFAGCKELAEINVDEANPVYKSLDGVLYDKQSGQLIYIPDANESKGTTAARSQDAVIEEGHGIFAFDGIRYRVSSENIRLNTGEWKDMKALCVLPLNEGSKYAGKLVIPDRVKYHNSWLEVVSWDKAAFTDSPELIEICLPATIREAWFDRIEGSPKLAAINVDAANEFFTSVNGILYDKAVSEIVCVPDGYCDSIELPQTVKKIGRPFKDNTNLRSIKLPDGLEEFWCSAFSGCSGLQEIHIPGSVKCVPEGCFDGCSSLRSVTFGDGVKSIDDLAFGHCPSLKEIVFPESIEEVKRKALTGCTGLEKIVFPEDRYFDLIGIPGALLPWGHDPFVMDGVLYAPYHDYKCTESLLVVRSPEKDAPALDLHPEVEELFIPAQVEHNGFTYKVVRCECMFGQFPNLHILHLPDSMRSVDLRRIPSLRQVIVSEGNETYASEGGLLYSKDMKRLMGVPKAMQIQKLVVRDGVEVIGTALGHKGHDEIPLIGIFEGHKEMEEIVLPDSVKVVGQEAFRDCTSLRMAKLGEGLEEIHSGAFVNTALESLTLPRSIKYVDQERFPGVRPFSGCTRLSAFEMDGEGETLKVIDGVIYQKADSGLMLIYCPPAYSGTLVIPDGVVTVYYDACSECRELVRVEMPDSLERINGWAFALCTGLEDVRLSRNLRYVGSCAFRECTGLKEVDFTVCERYFGYDDFDACAFMYCDGIKLKLPESLERQRQYIERNITHRVTAAELDATD